jgi:hypothetical protein
LFFTQKLTQPFIIVFYSTKQRFTIFEILSYSINYVKIFLDFGGNFSDEKISSGFGQICPSACVCLHADRWFYYSLLFG